MKLASFSLLAVSSLSVAAGCSSGASPVKANQADTDDTSASVSGWCHLPGSNQAFTATDGTSQIAFDYQVSYSSPDSSSTTAYSSSQAVNAWLTVSNSNFTGNENVTAVVYVISTNNNGIYDQSTWSQSAQLQVPLTWYGDSKHWSGPVFDNGGGIPLYGHQQNDPVYGLTVLQFSVSNNGNSLIDPESGTEKFQYFPSQDNANTDCKGTTASTVASATDTTGTDNSQTQ